MKMQLVLLFSLLTVCPKLPPKKVDSYRSDGHTYAYCSKCGKTLIYS